eukprot:CAMPEP_0179349176 /NCGR_PEP_ID=MMETSP0797-20121207/74097_1 /TAXON_ID=47934 /ORGANISM="Dinophysis acuminata, Strain DAEP01" /LENGTH=496 /DNA_ID=CAMNT_0021064033 /DNA_START=366 /DNA_END=1852 /DNA_ORIENTATION=+
MWRSIGEDGGKAQRRAAAVAPIPVGSQASRQNAPPGQLDRPPLQSERAPGRRAGGVGRWTGCVAVLSGLHGGPLDDGAPAYQAPVLLDAAAQGDLVVLLRADRVRQDNLGEVVLLDAEDSPAGRRGADVHHEDLSLLQLGHLACLVVALGLHAEETPKEVVLHLDLDEDARELAREAQDVAHEPVAPRQRGVDLGPHADQAAGHGELQAVALCREGHDPRADRLGDGVPGGVLAHDAGPDLDLVAELQHALQDGAARDAALQVLHLLAGLVHVEGADDDHDGVGHEVPGRDRHLRAEVLADDLDVVLQHCAERDDGGGVRGRPGHELLDLLVLGLRLLLLDELDLVLEDDDVLQPHDLHGRQVLRGLGLRARLVPRDEEERGVHHRGAVQHGRHENIVAGAVHEGHVPLEPPVALELVAGDDVLLRAPEGRVAVRRGHLRVVQLVDLRVRVAELDGDVTLFLLLEADGVDPAEGPHHRGLAVRHVADGAHVHRGLP